GIKRKRQSGTGTGSLNSSPDEYNTRFFSESIPFSAEMNLPRISTDFLGLFWVIGTYLPLIPPPRQLGAGYSAGFGAGEKESVGRMPGSGFSHAARMRAGLLTLISGLGLLSGCNLFSSLADDGEDLSYRGLILKGNQAVNHGKFAAAEDYFHRAMRQNHRGSEAYLYHPKASMRLYGISYNTLHDEFDSRCNPDGKGKKRIHNIDSTTTLK